MLDVHVQSLDEYFGVRFLDLENANEEMLMPFDSFSVLIEIVSKKLRPCGLHA